ncbi:hypothetical protein A2Z67_01860 [Candidatus Woesebacteria bacterium RBG_13_36_22]|uniref:SCP domain-containing protein n=1 Tax=Candidatus Woesebacteria bacterium RBG_13_36_22 TaxID=1802478 RepID=A0A1F7X386_9BACT|nr:MAG: hypothetical protein A2Z67_01860 [Candidatus Woesebacteria bacterium RBG_13_36_22]
MSLINIGIPWEKIIKVFLFSLALILFITVFIGIYFLGFLSGYNNGISDIEESLVSYTEVKITNTPTSIPPTPTPVVRITPKVVAPRVTWGGPELWQEVNKKRLEYGVNPLVQRDELCTVASIRLNELLELGKLDGHEGFSNLSERRSDLKWIFEEYSVVAEFLAVGGESPQETVSLWNSTLGHKKLLEGGEYVWGCIYAQNTFAVAITSY